ncbi:cystatin-like protein [Carassius auratus]|uniref:Cystatin-like protein n=1 Tax=Carassius auratus TaxID=7957 RepID=A0A6P6RE87_CARAU|nr:cystatin-like protein [Carassius auratus]
MRGVLFLLNALILLESTKGTTYDDLDDHARNIVNKAIEKANKDYGKGKHLDFHIIANRNNNMVNVILRPTSCDKKTPSVHRKDCTLQNTAPQVSCIDCEGTMKQCLLLRKTDEIQKRMKECPPKYNPGAGHIMFQISGNKQPQTGCVGCV